MHVPNLYRILTCRSIIGEFAARTLKQQEAKSGSNKKKPSFLPRLGVNAGLLCNQPFLRRKLLFAQPAEKVTIY